MCDENANDGDNNINQCDKHDGAGGGGEKAG
jgi:hypothetical protein